MYLLQIVILLLQMIESSNYDGSGRRSIALNVLHPYSIAIHNELVFWTDWQKKSIFSVRKDGRDQGNHTLVLPRLPGIMDIHAVSFTQSGTCT